jgi:hypothetical protein
MDGRVVRPSERERTSQTPYNIRAGWALCCFDNLQPAPLFSPRGTLRPHGPEHESPRSCEGEQHSRASFG